MAEPKRYARDGEPDSLGPLIEFTEWMALSREVERLRKVEAAAVEVRTAWLKGASIFNAAERLAHMPELIDECGRKG